MATTSIEWTDRVWNPVTGCTKVSPGCKHCYAETIADRFWATQYPPVTLPVGDPADQLNVRPRRFTDVMYHEDRLLEPLSWRKPAKVFVNSMSDLFHEDVPDEFIDRVFVVMGLAHQHTFQVLTKRAARMRAYMERLTASTRETGYADWPRLFDAQWPWLLEKLGDKRLQEICETPDVSSSWPLPNVWLGVSVEDQQRADERIPLLLQTPAAVRFVSAEPLLAPLTLRDWWMYQGHMPSEVLDWVIVGGESGQGARPCNLEWIRSVVEQCHAARVPVFVKQLGAKPQVGDLTGVRGGANLLPDSSGYAIRLRDRKGGDWSEWPEYFRRREFPEVRA